MAGAKEGKTFREAPSHASGGREDFGARRECTPPKFSTMSDGFGRVQHAMNTFPERPDIVGF